MHYADANQNYIQNIRKMGKSPIFTKFENRLLKLVKIRDLQNF